MKNRNTIQFMTSLFILIGLKVIVDFFSHKKEHKKFSA